MTERPEGHCASWDIHALAQDQDQDQDQDQKHILWLQIVAMKDPTFHDDGQVGSVRGQQ